MLTTNELLGPLAEQRTGEVVVTTMSTVREWGRLQYHELDFASADSAMGHAADLALGIALARPDKRVICLNGDGSMAMSLGTLLTVAQAGAANYALVVVDNGTYEITGNQPVIGAGHTDLAAMALAAGFAGAWSIEDPEEWKRRSAEVFTLPGPLFFRVRVRPGGERPLRRAPDEARYLHPSLAQSARVVRDALARTR
jgi:sulfopyruvate decarboxylase subunit beta